MHHLYKILIILWLLIILGINFDNKELEVSIQGLVLTSNSHKL